MSALYGRERELALLQEYLRRTLTGDQQLVLVEGEAGVGKTALLHAFAATAGGRRLRGPRILFLRAPGDEPYQPVHHAALAATNRRLYGRLGGTPQAREMARGMVVDWLNVVPVWGNLLNAIAGTADVLQRRRRERAFAEIDTLDEEIAALIAASHRRPLILLIDELERADANAVARLQALIEQADEGASILVVGAYRPTAPGLPDPPVHRLRRTLPQKGEFFLHLRLEGLHEAAIAAWARELFRGGEPPEPLLRWLAASTGGHPAMLEATFAHLTETGAARREGRSWHFTTDPEHLQLPLLAESVADLGALTPEIAEVVGAASALGEEFSAAALARLLGRDELAVEDQLALAVHYGVLQNLGERTLPDGEITTGFRFPSAPLRAALAVRPAPNS